MIWTTRVFGVITLFAGLLSLSDASPVMKAPGRDPSRKPVTHKYTFDISKFPASPDGYTADVLGVNKTLGIPIIVNKGDTIKLTAINHLTEPTSIHFHGMLQNGTNYMDGASMVTQCPIQPNNSFTYQFTVDRQHGTYWWHSHHKSQYISGLRGPLIIQDPDNEPYTDDYDHEIIVQLADQYHQDKNVILAQYFAPNGSGDEPMPNSGLINNKGIFNCSSVSNHVGGAVIKNPCSPNATWDVFNVTKGQRVRFRIINMSAMASFNFSIDGHKMDVIEADGVDTVKTTVDNLRISVAQRYSVIVNITQAVKDYWVRADIDTTQWPQNYTSFNPAIRAVLHYHSSKAITTPKTSPAKAPVFLDPYSLPPYNHSLAPASYDIGLSVRFDLIPDPNNKNITTGFMTVNDIYDAVAYTMPKTPTLFDVVSGNTLPNSSVAVDIPRNAVVELSIWNDDPTEHVFHLHGHQFWVLAHGDALNDPIRSDGTINYPVRDTVVIPGCRVRTGKTNEGICGGGLGYVRIMFISDNPGVWLLHCHMEWHMAAGLVVSLVVDADGLKDLAIPKAVKDTCKA